MLTTHFMEEADTLADRIAILSEGRLRCSGSSLYLKNRFGLGYLLSIAKSDAALIDPITEAVQAIVRDATVNSSIAGEVVYRMPIQAVPQFPELFAMLRDGASQLRITSYGISITTLEQVFIKLAREADSADLEDNFDLQNSQDEGLDSWSFRIQSLLWRIRQSFSGHRRIESLSQSDEERGIEIANSAAVATPSVGSTMAPTIVENQNLSDQGSSEVARAETIQYIALATTDGETKDKEDLVLPFAVYHTNESKTSIDEPMAQPVKVVEELPIVDDLPTATSSSFNSTLAAIAANIYIRQFVELYRKRLIIACRDYKGLFFQVIFPAIQIILIMLILTINVNPAGNTIVLSSNAFSRYAGFTPEVIFGGATTSFSDTETNLLNTRSDVDNILTNVSDSITLSKLMVDFDKNLTESYNNSFLGNGDNRYGAYLFDDRIPFNITVDWDWVKLNADFILQNEELINNLAEVFGFNATIDSLLVDNLNLNVDLISLLELINATANIDNNFNNFIATPINDNFNLSIGNNFGDVLDFLEETLNFTASANNVDAVIRIGSISYDPNRNTIRLFNISVVSTDTNLQLDINEVDLGLRNLTQLLPTGSESYLFDLESKKTVLFNSSSPHGAAIFQGEMVGAQYQTCSSAGTNSEYLIKNHPLPITLRSSLEIRVILSILTSLFILVPLCYIPAAFVAFLVKERVSKSKHLQFVSGVSPYMYWLGTYAWDLSLFAAIVGFILAGFFAFGEDAAAVYISEGESTVGLFLLLFLYGAAAIPLSYIYSFMFTNFSTAQISVMVINFMTGFVAVLAYFVMSNVPSTQAAAEDIVHFFRFFPPYNVGEGMINLAAAYFVNEVLDESVGYLDWEVSGRNIVFMAAQAVGYFGVILLTEFPPLQNLIYSIQRYRSVNVRAIPPPAQQPDEDVLKEAEHINDDGFPSEDYALVIKNLVKTYPATVLGGKPKHAVRGVSFACKNGERFGLLGINGAGKTTTLSILTADAQPTAGDVLIGGKSASHSSTHRMIGYCPQVDPLLDLMTGFETLRFFGRIRGLPESEVEEKVQRLVQQVGLRKHAHKPCGTYSGGNKRKLSLAVALIGDPRVLFLDEVSHLSSVM